MQKWFYKTKENENYEKKSIVFVYFKAIILTERNFVNMFAGFGIKQNTINFPYLKIFYKTLIFILQKLKLFILIYIRALFYSIF